MANGATSGQRDGRAAQSCVQATEPAPSRRELGRRFAAAAVGFGAIGAATDPTGGKPSSATPGLVRDAEAIHQEIVFASRSRVYSALTTADQFDKVMHLGVAMRTMTLPGAPTRISPEVGGEFVAFGGYIVGRHLEMVPGERLTQAWREAVWDAGFFSIVRFQLADHDRGAILKFDHAGFPAGAGPHLAIGWYRDYWEPLAEFLA
jgi:hypothetical protein